MSDCRCSTTLTLFWPLSLFFFAGNWKWQLWSSNTHHRRPTVVHTHVLKKIGHFPSSGWVPSLAATVCHIKRASLIIFCNCKSFHPLVHSSELVMWPRSLAVAVEVSAENIVCIHAYSACLFCRPTVSYCCYNLRKESIECKYVLQDVTIELISSANSVYLYLIVMFMFE